MQNLNAQNFNAQNFNASVGAQHSRIPADDCDVVTHDAIVLGAGISGLVAASVLLKQDCKSVLVVDEYSHIGGNHIDRTIGEYTFDVGSFIFQDDSPLLAHLPEILPLYVPIKPTWGRLNPQGVVTRYPISVRDDLIDAGPIEWLRILSSVLYARIFRRQLRNARDFAQYWIGARFLHRSGLENYMRRFYGIAPERIDIKFATRRMLWLKEHASLTDVMRRWLVPAAKPPQNQQLARPREGFSHLYQASVGRLERDGVTFLLAAKCTRLQRKDGVFFLEVGDRCVSAKRVVSTIPLEHIWRLCGMLDEVGLKAVTLVTLFYSFSGNRGFRDSILYNFSHEGSWKRLTMHSDFYGKAGGREFFAVEVNADHVSNSVETADEDFRRHVGANGLFAGDLRLEGSNVFSNAYPIYTEGADEKAARVIASLRELGIESFGRQGGFDYQPTAHHTTRDAEAALRR